jgi:hypothetical protein
MSSWWSSNNSASEEMPKHLSRDSYIPTPLDPQTLPAPRLDSLIERSRIQNRIWQYELGSKDITPLHFACMLGNMNTLHTLLCEGLYCPLVTMYTKPSGDSANPICLISSQPDDQSANVCLKMFLNALQACETLATEPIGTYKYVACKQCYKRVEAKPTPATTESTSTISKPSSLKEKPAVDKKSKQN